MELEFSPLGVTKEKLEALIKLGLKYDKRQKKQLLSASKCEPLQLKDIENFEEKFRLQLPESYRGFLLKHNGGIPNRSCVRVQAKEFVVQQMYALINPSDAYTLEFVIRKYKDRVPKGMLPFADDPAGNLFLINLGTGAYPEAIYFWDHEQEADTEPYPYYENIYLIASSFDSFISMLQA